MELSAYLNLLRRWLWLIAVAAIVAGSASFVAARSQPPRFQASTTIQVGTYSKLANPSSGMIDTAEQLTQTYIALLKTYPILDAVVTKLQLQISTDRLSGLFQTRVVPGTSLLIITVTYTDPGTATDIANELAAQLIINSPTNLTKELQQQLSILEEEINQAEAELQSARDEVKTIDANLAGRNSQEQLILTQRRTELIAQITTTQANLAQMTSTAASLQQQGTINSLRVVEPSRIADAPIGLPTLNNTLLAAAVGAVLAIGAAFLIEYLNNSLRLPSEIMPLLNTPLLGFIAPFGNKRSYKNKLITWTQPRSSISEAYRALRVNLLFRENSTETATDYRLYAVTSPNPSEGKSVTAANLAITFAITGMRVLIIDTDLRRPAMHQLFNLPNTVGLSNIWGNGDSAKAQPPSRSAFSRVNAKGEQNKDLIERSVQLYLSQLVQKTEIPGLDVITSGPSPTNPAELLDTVQMRELIHQVTSSQQYDAIFFDTPPVLVVSDSSIIANVAKAKMILVVESGRTSRAAALRTVQQLTALSIPVLGVVMNRLNLRDLNGGYGQYYYGYFRYGGDTDSDSKPRTESQSD